MPNPQQTNRAVYSPRKEDWDVLFLHFVRIYDIYHYLCTVEPKETSV